MTKSARNVRLVSLTTANVVDTESGNNYDWILQCMDAEELGAPLASCDQFHYYEDPYHGEDAPLLAKGRVDAAAEYIAGMIFSTEDYDLPAWAISTPTLEDWTQIDTSSDSTAPTSPFVHASTI